MQNYKLNYKLKNITTGIKKENLLFAYYQHLRPSLEEVKNVTRIFSTYVENRLYSNPETHKLKSESEKLTFHLIVSSAGTYNYKLAKFLTSMLNPFIPKDHCTKDSFSFCKEIKKVSSTNKFLIFMIYVVCLLAFLYTKQLT